MADAWPLPYSHHLSKIFARLNASECHKIESRVSEPLRPAIFQKQNRPLLDDLRAMLCADGLAVSRSSLHFFTFAHSRAETLIMPNSCGSGTYSTESRARHTEEAVLTNTTLVVIEKPDAEVHAC